MHGVGVYMRWAVADVLWVHTCDVHMCAMGSGFVAGAYACARALVMVYCFRCHPLNFDDTA